MNFKWGVTPKNSAPTGVSVSLSTFENDTRDTVYMIDGDGNEVGNVRVGSIIHWLLIKGGGKVKK